MKEKGWLLVEPNSSDTMDKSIGRAVETKTNWFGYYWSPTALVGRYNLKIVDFGVPFKGKQNWERCIVDQQCRNPQPSRWTDSIVRTVLTSEFKQREKLASTYLENRSFTNDVMSKLLDFMSNGKSADAAARKFLAEYPEIWHKWLPLKRLKVAAASLGLPTTVRVANSGGKSGEENQSSSSARTAETSSLLANTSSSAALTAARRKLTNLEEVGGLKREQQQEQQTNNDTSVPIEQLTAKISGKQGIVTGRVRDNTGIAELAVDGTVVQVRSDGRFEHRTFIPADGKQVLIEATDLAGLTSQKQLNLSRDAPIQSASISFDSLNPLGKRVAKNRDALALIVGVETYEQTPAQAIYADSDAKMFRDYATEKLGIPDNRIETLINDGADLTDMLLSVKEWLTRSVKQDKTDVYVFFAGHGLASDDGEKMYLLPYDGSPRLLDRTAIR